MSIVCYDRREAAKLNIGWCCRLEAMDTVNSLSLPIVLA